MANPEPRSSHESFRQFLNRLNESAEFELEDVCRKNPQWGPQLKALYRAVSATEREAQAKTMAVGVPESDFTHEFVERLRDHQPDRDRYQREDELAHGAQGTVYRVFDKDFRRYLAMKVGSKDAADPDSSGADESKGESRSLARLIEEAQVTGQLDHPGIVPIHDLGLDADGHFFFTMHLVRGETLGEVFARVAAEEDGWTLTRVLGSILKVCETMAFAHSRRVVHRDLKPANIMVGRFGELYVMDWGLARVLQPEGEPSQKAPDQGHSVVSRVWTDRKEAALESPESPVASMDGDIVGTPTFMSPEQAEGVVEGIGPATDIYSLGAMLYLLLSGKMPYEDRGSASPAVLWRRVVSGPPVPLEQLAPRAPSELVAITRRAMARRVEDRYGSMEMLADDLRAFLEVRAVSAYRTGPVVEFNKWVRRNRAVAAVAAALILLSVVGSWAYTWNEARRTREIRRYADRARAEELVEEVGELGAVHPANVERMESWIADAGEVLTALPPYETELAALRERALEPDEGVLEEDIVSHPLFVSYAALSDFVEVAPQTVARLRSSGAAAPSDLKQAETMERFLPVHRERYERLREQVELRRSFQLPSAQQQRVHDQLAGATEALQALRDREVPRVQARLDASRSLETRSIEYHAKRWSEARREIARHELYGGLELAPQMGLVPIGPDPMSGLWEFWHVSSGDEPSRDGEERIQVEERMGVVLVLLPAMSLFVGAQAKPGAPNYDPRALESEAPVEFSLAPFFLSKYELTQAQWLRLTDGVPSLFFLGSHWRGFGSVSGVHPVENITWDEAAQALADCALRLPTEAQWELGARAYSETPYHFGEQFSSDHAVNLMDASGARVTNAPGALRHDDGFPFHSPVQLEEANAFGLHGIHGNVREYCLDRWADRMDRYPTDPATGEVLSTAFTRHALRGGSYRQPPEFARLAYRMFARTDLRAEDIGVRPARLLDDPD
ncbi:MAG: serine/threonine protein kinase/formylglycine-generating enzyme required for sulfatase activity [Chlamydiales bacterium]|jgi:serine/threonine protein kinase/formylglycine-generating enzyme required for sulfatase activity